MKPPKSTLSDFVRIRIRNPLLNKWTRIQHRWNGLSAEKKEKLIFVANYGISAIPIAFLLFSILSGLYKNFFVLFIDTWIFILFFEYYYKWLRSGWKHS